MSVYVCRMELTHNTMCIALHTFGKRETFDFFLLVSDAVRPTMVVGCAGGESLFLWGVRDDILYRRASKPFLAVGNILH